MKCLSILFTSSLEKEKMIFRCQVSKLNRLAYSNTSVWDYTSGHTMKGRPLVHWRHGICRGAAGGVRAMAIAQEMSFPLSWVSPHSHTLTEWNKRGFFLPGSCTSGAGLTQKASIAMKLISLSPRGEWLFMLAAWEWTGLQSCCLNGA